VISQGTPLANNTVITAFIKTANIDNLVVSSFYLVRRDTVDDLLSPFADQVLEYAGGGNFIYHPVQTPVEIILFGVSVVYSPANGWIAPAALDTNSSSLNAAIVAVNDRVDVLESNTTSAAEVVFDDTSTLLGSSNVQGAIASLAAKFNNITGQYIGSAATLEELPTTDAAGNPVSNGDWAYLNTDVVGTGTTQNPQYPKGVYLWNSSIYTFGFAIGSNLAELILSEAITGTNTVPKAIAAKTLSDLVANRLSNISASSVSYNDVTTNLGSTDVQGAISALSANIKGRYIGFSSTFVGLPANGAKVGDWVYLTNVDGINPKGVYRWNGSSYVFEFEVTPELLLAEAVTGTNVASKSISAKTLNDLVADRTKYYAKPIVGIDPIIGNLLTGDRYLLTSQPAVIKTVGGVDETFPDGAITQTIGQDREIVRVGNSLIQRDSGGNVVAESALYYLDPQIQTLSPTNSINVNGNTTERITWNVAGKSDPNITFDANSGIFTSVTGGTYEVTYALNKVYTPASNYQEGIYNLSTNQLVAFTWTSNSGVKQSDQVVAGHRKSYVSGLVTVPANGKFFIQHTGGWGSWSSYWDATVFTGFTNANLSRWNYIQIEKVSGFLPVNQKPYKGAAPYPYSPLVIGDIWDELDTAGNFIESWFWSGAYWLSTQQYFEFRSFTNQNSTTSILYLVPTTEINNTFNLFLTKAVAKIFIGGANNATNYWGFDLFRVTSANTFTGINPSITTSSEAANVNLALIQNLNLHINTAAVNFAGFRQSTIRNGAAGLLSGSYNLYFRKARI
jgi:hypothetical protein